METRESTDAIRARRPVARSTLGQVLQQGPQVILAVLIFVMALYLTFATGNFFTAINLQAVAIGLATDAIMAVGMTWVLLMRSFDLSVGGVFALGGLVVGKALVAGWPVPLAIAAAIFVSASMGLANGLVISKVGVPNLIATLATMVIARGIVIVVTQGFMVSGFPESFAVIGQGYLGPVPYPVFIMAILVLVGVWLLKNTVFFHRLYFMGGNPQAARLSGIPVSRTEIVIYILCATLAGIAGMITTSRLGVVTSTFGEGAELRVIAACVLGGVSLAGGEGSIIGAVLGVVLMALITNAFVLLDISVYWQGVVYGLVLLVAVTVDAIRVRRQRST